MPRLLGVEIPADKRIEASLTYIYGIGLSTAKRILEQTNIDPNLRGERSYAAAVERNHSRDHEQQDRDRGRSAPRSAGQSETFAGDQFLSRDPSPAGPARARPAHFDKCPDPQRPA